MPAGYIPRTDADFDAWAANFKLALGSLGAGMGLTGGQIGAVNHALTDWQAAYSAHIAAAAAARAAAANKDDVRAAFESIVRPVVRQLQASPAATDAKRATLGITVPRDTLTPTAAPTSRPLVSVEVPARLMHTLRLTDESTPTSAARPAGTMGAEVWVAFGEGGATEPPPMSAYRFEAMARRGMVQRRYTTAQAGKTAFYQLRWVSTRGEKGPWSEVCAATVAA